MNDVGKRCVWLLSCFLFFLISCSEQEHQSVEINSWYPKSREVDSARVLKRLAIDSFFIEQQSNRGFKGYVLFLDSAGILFRKSYGSISKNGTDSLSWHSAFQLASVSKPITAVAILKLMEMGKLQLNDSIQRFIPDFPYKGINIKMLLTHKSGLFNYMYFADDKWKDWSRPMSNDSLLALIKKHQPAPYLTPNKKYNYSNTGFALLGSIIEKSSGLKYREFLKKHVFEPAGMKDAKVFNAVECPEVRTNNVIGYRGLREIEAENTYLNGVVGDKNVYCSAYDLMMLDIALRQGKLLSDSTLDLAFTAQHEKLHVYDNYGLGWRINGLDNNNKVVYHGGWWKGFKTYFIRELGSKKTIIVLTNHLNGHLNINQLRSLM